MTEEASEKDSKPKRRVGDGTPGPGRKKGIPNRSTVMIKDMILDALEGAGGAAYLEERAKDPRTAAAFLSLVGKVLPLQVVGANGGPVVFERIVREVVEAKPIEDARIVREVPHETQRLQ